MSSLRRRVATTLPWVRRGAAARPTPVTDRADWRAIVARGPATVPTPATVPAPTTVPAPVTVPAVPPRARPGHRSAAAAVAGAIALTMAAGVAARLTRPLPAATARMAQEQALPPVLVTRLRPPAQRAAVPARVEIGRIGVRSPLVPLGLLRDRTLATPADYSRAGWYTGGARPGERGPAVVVGHVDSRTGPAVFFRLGELRRGDIVRIVRADGTAVRYAVRTVRSYPKAKFPTAAVYGATRRPTLRLITCGGEFDARAGSYRDNVVVFADLLVHPKTGRRT